MRACADRPALRQQYIDMYSNNTFDIMVMPTTPVTAPPIYSVEPYMLFNGQYVSNRVALRRTAIIEATVGAPGLSIPMGLADNGMPVGIQIQSRPGKANLFLRRRASPEHTHNVNVGCANCQLQFFLVRLHEARHMVVMLTEKSFICNQGFMFGEYLGDPALRLTS